ncbi:MAG: glycosyltransferase [Candidatus Gracilibacteria bacterium]|nr:glycosyltransferase [Candidatus Gracilibacteria bacterium]
MKKISVIMPVYNTKAYLVEALESVLNQSFKDFEFIIVDDFSNDGSFELLQEYEKKDDRIKLFRNDKNSKLVYTLNRAILLSKGKYIVRMDSDDIIDLSRIEKQYNYMLENSEIDILSSNLYFIDKYGKQIGKREYNSNVDETILNESPICHACSIIKKEAFEKCGGYDERFNLAEDYDLWLRFYSKGFQFAIYNDYLYYYRIFDDSGKVKKLKQQLKMTIDVKENAIKNYKIKFAFKNYIRLYLEKFLYYFVPSSIILKLFLLLKGK